MPAWKAIVDMPIPVLEFTTSSAWYSRTLRMRRGPSTNICTNETVSVTPPKIAEIYINSKCEVQMLVADLRTASDSDSMPLKVKISTTTNLACEELQRKNR